jgi:hypothetical protein
MVHPLLLPRTFAKVHFNGKQQRRTMMRITGGDYNFACNSTFAMIAFLGQ